MDLKPLLRVCRGAGTTTALAATFLRIQATVLRMAGGEVRLKGAPGFAYLLVATAARAEEVARQFNLPRRFVLTLAEATHNGFGRRPGVVLCDTDALWALQAESDRLASQVAELTAQVCELTAWQAAARQMAEIKAEEVRDLAETVGQLQGERTQLQMQVRNLEADLDDLRHVRRNFKALEEENARLQEVETRARQYLQRYRREWKCAADLRRYGEAQRELANAVGVEWPLPSGEDDGAAPPPAA